MIRSMTAFAREEMQAEWGTAYWELRSVNNRYLDLHIRLPEDFRHIELMVRERIGTRVGRGKVECTLRVSQDPGGGGGKIGIDIDLAKQLADASREIDAVLHAPARVQAMDILRWPGVIRTASLDMDAVGGAVLELLDRAIGDLVATREREGAKIANMIGERCDEIEIIVARIRERLPEITEAARERLADRLRELREQLDNDRLEQEMVIIANKADVAEELDRLDAHLEEVRRVVAQKKPAGRRLDFLMQELNREANTLGSKSIDMDNTRGSVDLKVLIEQMREQVQNVE